MKTRNKTYRKVELKILKTVNRLCQRAGPFSLTVRKVAKDTQIAEGTVYRHTKGMGELIGKERLRVRRKFKAILAGEPEGRSLEKTIQKLLVEMYKERETIEVLFGVEGINCLEKSLVVIEPRPQGKWRGCEPELEKTISRQCRWWVVAEVLEWRAEHYKKEQIEQRAKHICWIVQNAARIYYGITQRDKE